VKLHINFFEDPQNDKKKNSKLWKFKIIKQKTLKIHKSKGPPHTKKNSMTPKMTRRKTEESKT
jgi:hypothetical protein